MKQFTSPLIYVYLHIRANPALLLPKSLGILVVAALLLTTKNGQAQTISLKKREVSLETVLKEIERQSQYVFLYQKKDLDEVKHISVQIKSAPAESVIKTILSNIPSIEHEFFDNVIIIKKRKTERAKLAMQKEVRGIVTTINNKPVHRVFVEEKTTGKYAYTDPQGLFKLEVPAQGTLQLSGSGFLLQELPYALTSDSSLHITLHSAPIEIEGVDVVADQVKTNPTRFIDLTNRNYMNLGQVLQGTIPGLSLQVVNTNKVEPTAVDVFIANIDGGTSFRESVRMSIDEFLSYVGEREGRMYLDQMMQGKELARYKLHTKTTVTNALVPQVRGSNNFANDMSRMLIVIDGFPQEGFPADYPMVNVESIEVVKDPKELIKWGPEASGGAILIRTKSANAGKINIQYTSNFFYSETPRYSRSTLRLASTPDYLDYQLDLDDIIPKDISTGAINLSPAARLLAQRRKGQIEDDLFNTRWDSLAALDNSDQLRQLNRNTFRNNHALTLSGGNKNYQATGILNYANEQSANLGSSSNEYGLNLNNKFLLLDNKLKIDWLINYLESKEKNGGLSFSASAPGLEPYQLLYDNQGRYIYDYTSLSPQSNDILLRNGYRNHGVNILEDARLNNDQAKSIQKRSRLHIDWQLLPQLKWSTDAYYDHRKTRNQSFYNKESSYVRQLVNAYGAYSPDDAVNFYLPYGHIYRSNRNAREEWNVRTALSYSQAFGQHQIMLGVGFGAAGQTRQRPAYGTLYGYNTRTKTGTPIYLSATDPMGAIQNFYALLNKSTDTYTGSTSTSYPFSLTNQVIGDTTTTRNMNTNLSIGYSFAKRFKINGGFSGVYTPYYGQSESTYSTLQNFFGEASLNLFRNKGKTGFGLDVASGIDENKMPDLLPVFSSSRNLQPYWNTHAIWVNGADPTQQKGQKSTNVFQKMTTSFLDSLIRIDIAYNTRKIRGTLSMLTNGINEQPDSTVTQRYFSVAAAGNLRNRLLNFELGFSKSPEGQDQWNGYFNYNIAHESYFKSPIISSLSLDGRIQMISPFQGLNLMMATNSPGGGGYNNPINSNFTVLPPKNVNYELHAMIGWREDRYTIDLRYYNQTTSGLDNLADITVDPATGLSSRTTFSSIQNRGVEFYLKTGILNRPRFGYNIIFNGAYNQNLAKKVPTHQFTASSSYTTVYREGYDTSNLWSVDWAGLNETGDPQIYDRNGKKTAILDSATVADALVYSGMTKAPWTGGFIHELRYAQFFARAALTFNWGHVMRSYRPNLTDIRENNVLIAERWQKAGDEQHTDIPRISVDDANSYRAFVYRNGTNTVVTADHIRLQEVMLGFSLPTPAAKRLGLSSLLFTIQAQNLAVWKRNKLGLDPTVVGSNGTIGLPSPRVYSCSINIGF